MRRILATLAVLGVLLFSAGSSWADDKSEANDNEYKGIVVPMGSSVEEYNQHCLETGECSELLKSFCSTQANYGVQPTNPNITGGFSTDFFNTKKVCGRRYGKINFFGGRATLSVFVKDRLVVGHYLIFTDGDSVLIDQERTNTYLKKITDNLQRRYGLKFDNIPESGTYQYKGKIPIANQFGSIALIQIGRVEDKNFAPDHFSLELSIIPAYLFAKTTSVDEF